ncbi:MAG TPA: tetratricopeptide repeat protein [Gemmatimonadales bacterium]|jgi:tetratricopeptide (TPR) repeat protein|nr:tetratricopeptide repeat protein [Gemmatimonadales bacterium]
MQFRAGLALLMVLAAAGPAGAQQADSVVFSDADSLDAELQYQMAMQAWEHEHYTAADSLLRQALRIDPWFPEANLAAGYLPFDRYRKLGEWVEKSRVPDSLAPLVAQTQEHLRLATLVDPFVGWGKSDFTFLPSWAMKNFTARERARLPAWFFYWRGLSYARGQEYANALGDLTELLTRLEQARDSEPTSALLPLVANEVRYLKAVIELKAGRTIEARQHFEEVLAQDLGMYMAHVKLADLHERNGAWNAAILERQRAVETKPGDPVLLYQLATTLARASHLADADTAVTRAIELNPHNAEYVYLAARVRLALGDTARASSTYRKFMAMAPRSLAADRVAAQLQLARLNPANAQ